MSISLFYSTLTVMLFVVIIYYSIKMIIFEKKSWARSNNYNRTVPRVPSWAWILPGAINGPAARSRHGGMLPIGTGPFYRRRQQGPAQDSPAIAKLRH